MRRSFLYSNSTKNRVFSSAETSGIHAHQAQGPPVDTQEMGNPDTACITYKLSKAVYRPLFELVWGKDSFDINFPHDTADICSKPGGAFGTDTTPVKLSEADRTKSNNVYDHWGQSID